MALALVAGGVIVLIRNEGNIYLVVTPVISKKNTKTVIEANELPYQLIVKESMLRKIGNFKEVEEESARDHILFALTWVLANHRLKAKIVLHHCDSGEIIS